MVSVRSRRVCGESHDAAQAICSACANAHSIMVRALGKQ